MTKKDTPLTGTRAKALTHMQRLLATSAAAMAVGDAGCHRGEPSKTDDAGAFGPPTADAGNAVTTAPDAGINVTANRDHGYAVVDPMPMPAFCPGIAPLVRAKAKKQADELVLTLSNAGGKNGFKYDQSNAPVVYSGTLKKHTVDAGGNAVVTVTPNAGATSVIVTVKGSCGEAGLVTISATVVVASNHVVVSQY